MVTVGPGKGVRFAVFADDGRRSMAWTVWTSRHTLDAYLTARPLGGTWKISLHQSGSWQSGFTGELLATTSLDIPSRHLDRWQQPQEFAPGMRRSVQVVIPDAELRRWPDGVTDDKPVTVVPAPGAGHAACVEFIFLAAQPTRLEILDAAVDVAALMGHDGSMLRVVSRQVPWTPADAEWLRVGKEATRASIDPQVLLRQRTPRGILLGKLVDGMRFAVDYAGDLDSR
jgi:hypothetical protein